MLLSCGSIIFDCSLLAHVSRNIVFMLPRNVRLPCRSTNVLDVVRVFKHVSDFLERLAGSLREEEENMDSHACVEDAEDHIDAPLDLDEGKRDEVT